MIVIDASASIEWVRATPSGRRVRERLQGEGPAHVPEIYDLECMQVLRKLVLRGDLEASRGHTLLRLLQQFDATRHRHGPLLDRAWQLRDNITPYDAAYVALAEALAVPLVTCDRRLAGSTGHQAVIELVVV